MDTLHYARVVFTSAHLNKYTICEIEMFIVVILTMSSTMLYRVLLYQCPHISNKPFSSFCPVPCHYLETWRLDIATSRPTPLHHPLDPRSRGTIIRCLQCNRPNCTILEQSLRLYGDVCFKQRTAAEISWRRDQYCSFTDG